MTAESISVEADARRWAVLTLGLDKQTESPDAAAVLRRVTESEYALAPEWIDAAQIVADPSSRDAQSTTFKQAAALGRHDRCRAALTIFFDLPGDERRRRWQDLVGDCATEPALTMWLKRLEPGLDVDLPPLTENSIVSHLIQTCHDVFLARPVIAARLRREFCELWRSDFATWEDATDEALERHPLFFEAIAPWVDEFGDRRWRESLQEAKPTPVREPWAVPLEPTPPRPWIGYSEKLLNYTSLALAVLFFGLVLALGQSRRDYKPPVPQRDWGRFPSPEETRRLAPLFDKLREAERKRNDQQHQDSERKPPKSVPDDATQYAPRLPN